MNHQLTVPAQAVGGQLVPDPTIALQQGHRAAAWIEGHSAASQEALIEAIEDAGLGHAEVRASVQRGRRVLTTDLHLPEGL